jgi:hypothetical protein
MDGATAAEVFAARFVLPLIALVIIVPVCAMLRIPGGWVFMGSAFFVALLYAYPESGLKRRRSSARAGSRVICLGPWT